MADEFLDRDAGVVDFDDYGGSETGLDRDAGVVDFDDYGGSETGLDRDAGSIDFDDYGGSGPELPDSYYDPPTDDSNGGSYDVRDGRSSGKAMHPSPGPIREHGGPRNHAGSDAAERGAKIAATLIDTGASATKKIADAVRGSDHKPAPAPADRKSATEKGKDGNDLLLGGLLFLLFGG